jgi:L-amino acid N-acyltransferase YncA
MAKIDVREIQQHDYTGIRAVDELTQRQYLGLAWDQLSEEEKEVHLESRRADFELNLAAGYCFVGVVAENVVGFILAHETLPFRGTIYVRHIAVHPVYQGSGIGVLLYQAVREKALRTGIRKITALINLDNPSSMKLHAKMGFELIDRKQAVLVLP